MWCNYTLLCIFFCYCSVSSPLEESEDENNDVDPPGTKFDDPLTTKDCIIGHGPHPKLSRGEEIYNVEREFKIVNEKKFICSIDLLICMFQARCQTPGCDKSPEVNYHFIGPTVIVNCLCPQGHKFRFCSSHQRRYDKQLAICHVSSRPMRSLYFPSYCLQNLDRKICIRRKINRKKILILNFSWKISNVVVLLLKIWWYLQKSLR
jgi:hypothetical protein